MNIKKYIPGSLLISIKVMLRKYKDFISGDANLFAQTKNPNIKFDFSISITQPIKKTEYFENKIHNILKGANFIDGTIIYPDEIFSFWNSVSKPSEKNGYKLSRNIISGVLTKDYGGGLCQVSSIIYHMSIIAGMKIKERYNHSVDIYKEEERFTPLGADAAVVFGYKDLRIQNNYSFPVKLSLSILNNKLECTISSTHKITEQEIYFQKTNTNDGIEIATYAKSNHENILLDKSIYKKSDCS